MGRGTIVSHQGAGIYTVDVNYLLDHVDSKISELENSINLMQSQITLYQQRLNEAQTEYQQKLTAKNAAIAAAGPNVLPLTPEYEAIKKASEEEVVAHTTYLFAKNALDKINISIESMTLEKARLETVRTEKVTLTVHCADRADGQVGQSGSNNAPLLSGEVALIEPDLDPDSQINIAPAYFDSAAYSAASHGEISYNPQQGDYEYLFNWTMIDGVKKWKPIYRSGTVASKSGADLTVDISPVAGLGGDPLNVPTQMVCNAVYMTCNAAAFEVGDQVIVEITVVTPGDPDSYTGTVIGFLSNPKECPKKRGFHLYHQGVYYTVQRNSADTGWETQTGVIGGPYGWMNRTSGELFSWKNTENDEFSISHPLAGSNALYVEGVSYSVPATPVGAGYPRVAFLGRAPNGNLVCVMKDFTFSPATDHFSVHEMVSGSWVLRHQNSYTNASPQGVMSWWLAAATDDLSTICLYTSRLLRVNINFDCSDPTNVTSSIDGAGTSAVFGSLWRWFTPTVGGTLGQVRPFGPAGVAYTDGNPAFAKDEHNFGMPIRTLSTWDAAFTGTGDTANGSFDLTSITGTKTEQLWFYDPNTDTATSFKTGSAVWDNELGATKLAPAWMATISNFKALFPRGAIGDPVAWNAGANQILTNAEDAAHSHTLNINENTTSQIVENSYINGGSWKQFQTELSDANVQRFSERWYLRIPSGHYACVLVTGGVVHHDTLTDSTTFTEHIPGFDPAQPLYFVGVR